MSKRIAFLYQQARKIKYRVLSGWKSKITGRARCNQPVLVLGPGSSFTTHIFTLRHGIWKA
jgi:hypothetical protein